MDKKICAFSQTYGDDREELYEYLKNDNSSINFRNSFDLNLYSFHNSSREYIDRIKKEEYFTKLKNLKLIEFNNIEYTHTLRNVLYGLLDEGYNYIFYLQDDCFTHESHRDITDLIDFIKNEDFNMLYLESDGYYINSDTIRFKKDTLTIYDTTTQDFFKRNGWGMDDGAYIANIKFLLTKVYDEKYFSIGSIQKAEQHLSSKFSTLNIERLTPNFKLYRRFSIVGPNAHWDESKERQMLIEKFK